MNALNKITCDSTSTQGIDYFAICGNFFRNSLVLSALQLCILSCLFRVLKLFYSSTTNQSSSDETHVGIQNCYHGIYNEPNFIHRAYATAGRGFHPEWIAHLVVRIYVLTWIIIDIVIKHLYKPLNFFRNTYNLVPQEWSILHVLTVIGKKRYF